tara:strand:- start:399 stop:653 length:255 start_codon:yes stop_codon:yes gene_type:complete
MPHTLVAAACVAGSVEFDRRNEALRRPNTEVGRHPPMALINRQQGLPQAWPRPAEDCSPQAPFDGAVAGEHALKLCLIAVDAPT